MGIDKDFLYETIAKRIKSRRERALLTQADLAKKVHLLRTSVSNIEAGLQRPPLHVLYEICEALNMEILELLPEKGVVRSARSVSLDDVEKVLPASEADMDLTRSLIKRIVSEATES